MTDILLAGGRVQHDFASGRATVESLPSEIRYANGIIYRRAPFSGESVPVWEMGGTP